MILLALGSNIAPREQYILRALQRLAVHGVHVEHASSLMETPALLPPEAPGEWDHPFLNQVVRVSSSLPPQQLMDTLKRVEKELGRSQHGRWGPREIDIDLLAYDALVMASPKLTLPHPHLHERRFVLQPLVEIAPHWRYPAAGPLAGRTAAELLEALP